MIKNSEIKEINKVLAKFGILEVAIVSPEECIAQKKNARYFHPEIFKQLVDNIKKDGTLSSVPLVYKKGDKYHIISGHHRIEASKESGIDKILVMVDKPKNRDVIVSKQLSHNALVGEDDELLLKELFESIKSVSERIATGLADAIGNISYTSLNFKIGLTKEFTILFLPEDIGIYDETIEEIIKLTSIKPKTTVRLATDKEFDKFAKAIRKIKKTENVKSNAVALTRLIELAEQQMMINYVK